MRVNLRPAIATVVLLLLTALCLFAPALAQPQTVEQHKAMHGIDMELGSETSFCTAYAVGKQALATAHHCWLGNKIKVDGQPAVINQVITDGEDHDLWLVSGITFKDYVALNIRVPAMGEHIHLWGNPSGIRDQYREGYVMGFDKDGSHKNILFDLHTMPGDSGALIFGADGSVVGMTHAHIDFVHESYFFKFTPAQLKQAQDF